MIYGVGFDLVEIERIERILNDTKFLTRFFTEYEAEYINKNGKNSAAGIFSAKEAFSKSIGTGISGFSLKDIEVCHDKNNKPYLTLYGNIKNKCENEGIVFHLSITHTDKTAGAVVIAEKFGG